MRVWLVIAAAGAGTYAFRASLILLLGGVETPPVLARAFRYVGPGVMAAIAVPAFVAPMAPSHPAAPRIAAAAVAALVAWRFRTVPGTLVAGLGTYGLLSVAL